MDRRDFLKKSCGVCAAVAGLSVTATALQSCSGIPAATGKSVQNKITVPLSAFGESNLLMIRTSLPFDILLVKKGTDKIIALYMCCSHQENPLAFTKKGLNCPSHGSRFDFNGNAVLAPATAPLKQFATTIENNQMIIHH